jgi:hypothetical protein
MHGNGPDPDVFGSSQYDPEIGHAGDVVRGPRSPRANRRALVIAGCAVAVSALAFWMMLTTVEAKIRNNFSMVWLAYVVPNPGLWDAIHGKSNNDIAGGIWHYDSYVHDDIFTHIKNEHSEYKSVLDLACNMGFILERLSAKHPDASHYGTDISKLMVNRTARRCTRCTVKQFDINDLRDPEFEKIGDGFPASFDLVIVSDVLYYMKWMNYPPLVFQTWSHFGWKTPPKVRADQIRFFRRLQGLARREVIFSDHQDNSAVIDFLIAMNATRRGTIFTANGTA